MDQSIDGVSVSEDGRRVRLFLVDSGEIPMPVIADFGVAGGEGVRITASHEDWSGGRMEVEVELPGPVTGIVLDPDRVFPDVNRADNEWFPPR
jgi:hypothetical protein